MVIKVGINGFGRIGRIVSRTCLESPDLQLTAINDPAISIEYILYLIKFDSTHGKFKGDVSHSGSEVIVDDHHIKVYHEKLPSSIPWQSCDVQYVVEASGMFTNYDKAKGHLENKSVKRVIVTAPSVDIPMIILGVNDNKICKETKLISCTSSTLYCLAPIVKVLEDSYGIEEGFITSIHAMTPSLKPLDGLCLRGRHWRDHRSIHQNIIPANTGACKALGKILPQVKDKLSGLAFRVPIVNVSVLDLTIRLNSHTSLADIVKTVQKASGTRLGNILKVSSEETVSSDFIGETHSCIFDVDSSIQLKPNFFKIICWYENEYSYACRVIDTIKFCENQDRTVMKNFKLNENCMKSECLIKLVASDGKSDLRSKTPMPSGSLELKPAYQHQLPLAVPFLHIYKETKRTEFFKIWNDTKVISPPSNVFQSCSVSPLSPPKMIEIPVRKRLENVKREFNKMVNITESLLMKTLSNQSSIKSTSIDDVKEKDTNNAQIIHEVSKKKENGKVHESHGLKPGSCGDYKKISQNDKSSVPNSKDYESRSSHTKDMEEKHNKNTLNIQNDFKKLMDRADFTSNDNGKVISEIKLKTSKVSEFEELVMKRTISNLIDDLTESTIFEKHDENAMISDDNNTNKFNDTNFNLSKPTHHNNDVPESQSPLLTDENVPIVPNINNTEIRSLKIVDQELRKRNIILVDNQALPGGDNLCKIRNTDEDHKDRMDSQKKKIRELKSSTVLKVSKDPSRCASADKTVSTLSYIFSEKQDIYDKLDSASGSDSDNSFEINKRKSQIIQITDLTNSLEDLARLDKICRIIEISDELSDKLFSVLEEDKDHLKQTKWSFKDLCDRIKLDEFCNKVFGRQS